MPRPTPCIAFALLLLISSSASAVTRFNVTTDRIANGAGVLQLIPGETLTIDIRLSDGTDVFGLSASAFGYDESVIDFTSGMAVSAINYHLVIPSVATFPGLTNYAVPNPFFLEQLPLSESEILAHGNRVSFMSGVSLGPTHSNRQDPGLNFSPIDAQFRLVFTAIDLGESFVQIGTGYPGDGEVGPGGSLDTSANVPLRIEVVPEPVAGVLMALGLAALSATRRE